MRRASLQCSLLGLLHLKLSLKCSWGKGIQQIFTEISYVAESELGTTSNTVMNKNLLPALKIPKWHYSTETKDRWFSVRNGKGVGSIGERALFCFAFERAHSIYYQDKNLQVVNPKFDVSIMSFLIFLWCGGDACNLFEKKNSCWNSTFTDLVFKAHVSPPTRKAGIES